MHSFVQPPVKALGNQAMTTACFPANCLREYSLPSDPFSLKSGAFSPSLATFGSSAAKAPDKATAVRNRAADEYLSTDRMVLLLDAETGWERCDRVQSRDTEFQDSVLSTEYSELLNV